MQPGRRMAGERGENVAAHRRGDVVGRLWSLAAPAKRGVVIFI